MAIIHVRVVRALRHCTGRKAGTALDTASIPVMDVAPEVKARARSKG
jgi:hypothetical protein